LNLDEGDTTLMKQPSKLLVGRCECATDTAAFEKGLLDLRNVGVEIRASVGSARSLIRPESIGDLNLAGRIDFAHTLP
jgi:hypothetical protein